MNNNQRILLIQLFSNGDCLYATTIAKQIKIDTPNCTLQWLVLKPYTAILKNNPYIDELIVLDKISDENADDTYNRAINLAEQKIKDEQTDKYYFSQILGDNISNYDGCLRRSIFRGYNKTITVDKSPILVLDEEEKNRALTFAQNNNLAKYTNVLLFETSPLSGQTNLSEKEIIEIACAINNLEGTCIILSSYKSFDINLPNVFDGSTLSIRETVALTHFCTHLVGCSSGITWASISTAGKQLPMLQLLNANAYYFNPPSIDFKFSNIDETNVIELYNFTPSLVIDVVKTMLFENVANAREKFNQSVKNKFKIYRGIVHNFLAKGKIKLLKKFITINLKEHGWNWPMLKSMTLGFILFPFQLCINFINKK